MLGIGVADRVLILENAYYSASSARKPVPRFRKDRKHAPEAAEALKLTAQDLVTNLGVVDEIVPVAEGGAHRDPDLAAANLGTALRQNLQRIIDSPIDELLTKRYEKFRGLGNFAEDKRP